MDQCSLHCESHRLALSSSFQRGVREEGDLAKRLKAGVKCGSSHWHISWRVGGGSENHTPHSSLPAGLCYMCDERGVFMRGYYYTVDLAIWQDSASRCYNQPKHRVGFFLTLLTQALCLITSASWDQNKTKQNKISQYRYKVCCRKSHLWSLLLWPRESWLYCCKKKNGGLFLCP